MKKNNPMFISSTHGAYDFVDFTAPPPQINPPPSNQSSHHPVFKPELKPEIPHLNTQSKEVKIATIHSPDKNKLASEEGITGIQPSPVRESNRILRSTSGQLGYNFQPKLPIQKQEQKLSQNQESLRKYSEFGNNSKVEKKGIENTRRGTLQEFTEDSLIELLSEPHRSNMKALKMKSKSVPRLTF